MNSISVRPHLLLAKLRSASFPELQKKERYLGENVYEFNSNNMANLNFKKIIDIILHKPHRILPHIKTRCMFYFRNFLSGRAAYPHTVYVGITNNCNLKCRMCDLGQKIRSSYGMRLGPEKELAFSSWKGFIDDISSFSPAVELCAAEPLLYRDFIPLVKYIKQKKLVCRIFTNGFLLEKYAAFLKQEGVDNLFISIDGPAQIHDNIRGSEGLFDRIIRGLKILNEDEKEKPSVDINFTVSQYNYNEIEHTINAVKDRGVRFDRFTVMLTLFTTRKAVLSHNQQYPEFPADAICEQGVDFEKIDVRVVKEQVDRLREKFHDKIRLYPNIDISRIQDWYQRPDSFLGNIKCNFIWNSANITCAGEVIANFRCVKRNFGNINQSRFKGIWNSKDFRRFRLLCDKKGPFPICARCSSSFVY